LWIDIAQYVSYIQRDLAEERYHAIECSPGLLDIQRDIYALC